MSGFRSPVSSFHSSAPSIDLDDIDLTKQGPTLNASNEKSDKSDKSDSESNSLSSDLNRIDDDVEMTEDQVRRENEEKMSHILLIIRK